MPRVSLHRRLDRLIADLSQWPGEYSTPCFSSPSSTTLHPFSPHPDPLPSTSKGESRLLLVAHPFSASKQRGSGGQPLTPRPPTSSFGALRWPVHCRGHTKRIVLAVGPERGWQEPDELDLFCENGFQLVALAPSIGPLRTELALSALITRAHEKILEQE